MRGPTSNVKGEEKRGRDVGKRKRRDGDVERRKGREEKGNNFSSFNTDFTL